MKRAPTLIMIGIASALASAMAACAPTTVPPAVDEPLETTASDAVAPLPDGASIHAAPETAQPAPGAALPTVVVHKSPSCGCCGAWVEHLRTAGFTVEVRDQDNLEPVKSRLGVPYGKGSCHTAEVGGYFVEGHVPAGDIRRLLAQHPDARGLALPGMPIGSPGMESPDGHVQPYTVELVAHDGSTRDFTRHGEQGE